MRLLQRAKLSEGFTLVEVLTAATLATVGVGATIGVFGASHKASIVSQRREVAVQQAQSTLDRMQLLDYAELAMTSQPSYSSDVNNPFHRVSGANLTVRPGLDEAMAVDATNGRVATGPENFAVGTGSSQITGKLYRFVTWRDENCAAGTCDGTQNTKRLTVAVSLDPSGALPASSPVWISSVTADPNAGPPGSNSNPNPNPGNGNLAQTWYLYDTRCSQTARAPISSDHNTHNTAARGTTNSIDFSTCENADLTKRADLMGTTPPPGDSRTPLYRYSADLAGTYPGGLALRARGSTCPTSYQVADSQNQNATNMWNVHAWSTNQFTSSFSLTGRVVLAFYTQTVGSVAARGMICATLIDRATTNGIPTDTVLGSQTYDTAAWPTTPTQLTFSWDLPATVNVAANHRLVLALSVRGESGADIDFLYDHPTYPTYLQVATTTPLP